jgi:hypothetical protein
MISLSQGDIQEKYEKFGLLFDENHSLSELYKDSYIFKPISITAKFKQNSSAALLHEPLYQLNMDIDEF